MFKSVQEDGRNAQGEGSVMRGNGSRFFCAISHQSDAFLVRKRGCVSARGGYIELQIARGQMDIRPRTNSRLLVATAKKHSETLKIFRSCRSRILVTSIPRSFVSLDSRISRYLEQEKEKNEE